MKFLSQFLMISLITANAHSFVLKYSCEKVYATQAEADQMSESLDNRFTTLISISDVGHSSTFKIIDKIKDMTKLATSQERLDVFKSRYVYNEPYLTDKVSNFYKVDYNENLVNYIEISKDYSTLRKITTRYDKKTDQLEWQTLAHCVLIEQR